jgi:hypothetical protein
MEQMRLLYSLIDLLSYMTLALMLMLMIFQECTLGVSLEEVDIKSLLRAYGTDPIEQNFMMSQLEATGSVIVPVVPQLALTSPTQPEATRHLIMVSLLSTFVMLAVVMMDLLVLVVPWVPAALRAQVLILNLYPKP